MEIPKEDEDELTEHNMIPDDLMEKDMQSPEFILSSVDETVDFEDFDGDGIEVEGQNSHYQSSSHSQSAIELQIMSSLLCLLCRNSYNIHDLQNLDGYNGLSNWKIKQFITNAIKACGTVRKDSNLVRYISDGIDKTNTGGEHELPFCRPCFLKLSSMQRFSDKTRLMQKKLKDLKASLIQEFQNACSGVAPAVAATSGGGGVVGDDDVKSECFEVMPEAIIDTEYFEDDFEEPEDSHVECIAGAAHVNTRLSSRFLDANEQSQSQLNKLGIIRPCSVVLERQINLSTVNIVTPANANYQRQKIVKKPQPRRRKKSPRETRARKSAKSLPKSDKPKFKRYKCRICLKNLMETEGSLTKSKHEAHHFTSDTKYYNCSLCSRIFHFRGNFIKHLSQGHGENELLANGGSIIFYYCDAKGCEHCFASQSLLETHIQTVHHPLSWTCVNCGRMFAQEENFKTHQLEIHENGPNTTIMSSCQYCHLSFDSTEDLAFHKGIHEINLKILADREHFCEECGSSFVSALNLAFHVRKQHSKRTKPSHAFDAISLVTRSDKIVEAQRKGNFSFLACGDCGKTFSTSWRLNMHSYEHMTNHPGFPCPQCDQVFNTPVKLSKHRAYSHRKVRCEYCQKGIWSILALPHHLFKHHRDVYLAEKPFLCEVCFKNFITTEELVAHAQIHENARCKICNLQCANMRGLKVHERAHYVNRVELPPPQGTSEQETTTALAESGENVVVAEVAPPICLVCHEEFQTEAHLKDHYLAKHENIVLKGGGGVKADFICPRPTIPGSLKRNLGAQISKIQRKNYSNYMKNKNQAMRSCTTSKPGTTSSSSSSSSKYTCETCGKSCSTALTLRNHELIHLPKDEQKQRSSVCDICGKSYLNPQSFYVHMKSHQHLSADSTKSPTFTRCLYCHETFRDRVVRRRHQIRVHREQALAAQPFYCDVCFFQFSTEEELSSHSSSKHFKCQHCGKNFFTNLKLSEHENSHTGKKPYSCQICGSCFASHSNLNMHKKMHSSGGKQFQCVQCSNVGKDAKFYAQSELNKHTKRCHPIIGDGEVIRKKK